MKIKTCLASLVFGCSMTAAAQPLWLGCTIESSLQAGEVKPTSPNQMPLLLILDVQRRSAQMASGVFHNGSPAVVESWTDKLIVFSHEATFVEHAQMKTLERTRFDQTSGRFEITYDFLNSRGQSMLRAEVLENLKKINSWGGFYPGLTYMGKCKKTFQ